MFLATNPPLAVWQRGGFAFSRFRPLRRGLLCVKARSPNTLSKFGTWSPPGPPGRPKSWATPSSWASRGGAGRCARESVALRFAPWEHGPLPTQTPPGTPRSPNRACRGEILRRCEWVRTPVEGESGLRRHVILSLGAVVCRRHTTSCANPSVPPSARLLPSSSILELLLVKLLYEAGVGSRLCRLSGPGGL